MKGGRAGGLTCHVGLSVTAGHIRTPCETSIILLQIYRMER